MKTLFTTVALIISTTLFSQIIWVPTDYSTIQEGIIASSDGDTVIVEEGTYYENINYWGKSITVSSRFILDGDTDHITNTIIDGSQPEDPNYGSTVTFESGEDTTSVIMGFTITGGIGTFVPAIPLIAGGGIICNFSGATITNNIITNNNIESFYHGEGAGIAVGPPDTYAYVIIRDNMIHDNSISANEIPDAGGIAIRSSGLIIGNEIYDNMIESSTQYANAAGIYCGGWDSPSYVDIIDNKIYGNEVFSSSTGEVSCQGGGLMIYKNIGIISNNEITENLLDGETILRGAGVMIAVVDSTLIFKNNRISNNYFSNGECWGGGIYIQNGTPAMFNNVISRNEASIGGGLFLYLIEDDPIQIINNTITENIASEYAGAINLYNANALVMNTICWGNDASEDPEIYFWGGDLNVVYSDIDGGWPGEGNIDEDPEFEDDTMFHISGSSFCIGAGNESFEIAGEWYYCPPVDYEGDPRPDLFGNVDIGADEYFHVGIKESKFLISNFNFQIYPNPSFGISDIRYQISDIRFGESSRVSLGVFDIHGQMIRTLVDQKQVAGEYVVQIDASNLPAGIYFIRLSIDTITLTEKFIKMRK